MIEIIIWVVILAFILEYIDAAFGMGYGTILAPVLILIGLHPLEAIFAILFSNIFLGFMAGFFHHRFGNVNFKLKSKDSKVTYVLMGFGIVGAVIASNIAVRISEFVLSLYIGLLLLTLGIIILIRRLKDGKFSWNKIMILGTVAAFNKGMSSSGYGSVLVGGQILSGVGTKRAIGTTLLAEAVVSLIAVLIFAQTLAMNWSLAISLLIGGAIAVPLAGYTVKRFDAKKLKVVIALIHIVIGLAMLIKLLL